MSEPNEAPEPEDVVSGAHHEPVRTEGETRVDDALGEEDDPR